MKYIDWIGYIAGAAIGVAVILLITVILVREISKRFFKVEVSDKGMKIAGTVGGVGIVLGIIYGLAATVGLIIHKI